MFPNPQDALPLPAVIEMLIDASTKIEEGSLEWLAKQTGPPSVKARIAALLRRHGAKS